MNKVTFKVENLTPVEKIVKTETPKELYKLIDELFDNKSEYYFYCINITNYELSLQGKATKETLELCKELGFELIYDNFWFKANCGKVVINLSID